MRTELVVIALVWTFAGAAVRAEDAGGGAPASPPTAPAPVASAGKATLAVLPFEAAPGLRSNRSAEIALLEDALVRAFVSTNKFDVLERSKMQSVIDEHQFSASSLADPGNAAALGKLSGAQYLVVGNVHELGVHVSQEEIPYVHEWKCTESASLRIELRVVQTKLGRIVAAHDGGGNESAPFRQSGRCGTSADRMLSRAIGRISEVLVGKVLDAVYPLRVVHVSDDEVVLNRGAGSDFKVGSTLDCFVSGTAIVDPDTGDVLGSDETPAGTITVTAVMPKLTKARPVEHATIPSNAVCRVARRDPVPKPLPKPRKPTVNW